MASTGKPADPEFPTKSAISEAGPPPPPPAAPPCRTDCFALDVALRVLLLAAAVTSVAVMVTSKQTEPFSLLNSPPVPLPAKFNHSPAFIYFVAALSVTALYSIITTLASISVILKPDYSKKFLLHFAVWDLLILGVVASAVGAAGAIAYTGLKGESHVGWIKVCSVYDKFCTYLASSIAVALFAAVLLVLLVILSILSLHKRIPD